MLKKHVRCCRNIKNRKSEKAIGFSEVVEILLRVDVGARQEEERGGVGKWRAIMTGYQEKGDEQGRFCLQIEQIPPLDEILQ